MQERSQSHSIRIAFKLATMCLAFTLPLVWLLYTNITSYNAAIRFNYLEYLGDQYLKPLVKLLELVPEHGNLTARANAGQSGLDQEIADTARAIDAAFDELAAVDAAIGEDLQFTDHGLAIRQRSHLKVDLVRGKWNQLKAAGAGSDTRPAHADLTADIMNMIAHTGDTSNLILDPDLDSYYIMDIVLLALPQTQLRLAQILESGEDILAPGGLDESSRRALTSYAAMLEEADLSRVQGSTATALNEDANFLGTSPSLQGNVPPSLERYAEANQAFIDLLRRIADAPEGEVDMATFRQARDAARNTAFRYWDTAVAELDFLLSTRVNDYKSRRLHTLVGLGVALAVACALAIFVSRGITTHLSRVVAFVRRVADGDLDTAHEIKGSTAEVLVLEKDMQRMVASLREALANAQCKGEEAEEQSARTAEALDEAKRQEAEIKRLLDNMRGVANGALRIAEDLGGVARDLAAKVRETQEGAEVQRTRASETATAMEQMTSTVLEVARNASEAAEGTDRARQTADSGAQMVNSVVTAINKVHDLAENLKANMEDLGAKAVSIGKVMDVISDIADQTNLLALNAAIEAARAGEAGRGFAVVADEVRKLAEKTMTATNEVGGAISAIQDVAKFNVQATEEAVRAVAESTGLAQESGGKLSEIVRMVEASADQVRAIATASEEQSAASEQISHSVEEINRISSETAESMATCTHAVESLSEMVKEMETLVAQLKD